MLLLVVLGLVLQCCRRPDPVPDEPIVNAYTAPSFEATNLSVEGDKPLTAKITDGIIINFKYTFTFNVDGEPKVIELTYSSNQLPVMAGNEVEIVAEFDEEAASSYVCFTMPDGTKQIVTKAYPKCKWTVPVNFVSGDKIYAQWVDNNGKILYPSLSSSIVIIALEK